MLSTQARALSSTASRPAPPSPAPTRAVTDVSDLFFSCEHETPATTLAKSQDMKLMSSVLESFLAKAAGNFELEISSTRVMTSEVAEVTRKSPAHSFELMLARGASFSH